MSSIAEHIAETTQTPEGVQAALDRVTSQQLEAIKNMTLVERIWHIQNELGRVPKHGENKQQGYDYLRDADLAAYIGTFAEKYRIIPIFYQDAAATVIDATLKSAQGKPMTGTLVTEMYDIINIDDPTDRLSALLKADRLTSQGYCADIGDKAIYKARTGGRKYAYIGTFRVSSGDDPETASLSDEKDGQQRPRGGRQGAPAASGGPATDEQIKAFQKRCKGVKAAAVIAAVGQALRQNINVKPSALVDLLKTVSKTDMDRVLAEVGRLPQPPRNETPQNGTPEAPQVPSA